MPTKPIYQSHANERRNSHQHSDSVALPGGRRLFAFDTRARRIRRTAELLAEYYSTAGRSFPWRSTQDPFLIAIAEILLQKTRAQNAAPIYLEVVRLYPTPRQLAFADLRNVERQIQRLGLFRKRARSLVGFGKAVDQLGVSALRDPTLSLEMPGIGEYGAHAIACFAFGAAIGIVDANVRRVLRRVFGLPKTDPRDRRYQELADRIVRTSARPRDVNLGILDLGASICGTRPKCKICPLVRSCVHAKLTRSRLSNSAVR